MVSAPSTRYWSLLILSKVAYGVLAVLLGLGRCACHSLAIPWDT